jgi:DNA primase
LGIKLSDKRIRCWKCRQGGDVRNLIQELDKIEWREVRDVLRKYQTFEYFPDEEPLPLPTNKAVNMDGLQKIERGSKPWNYLSARGLDPDETISQFGLRYGGQLGFFCYRIVIPVFSSNEVVNLIGRDITGVANIRYKFLPITECKIPREELIYNLDNVGDTFGILEGCFDVFAMGIGNAVATFGTAVTPKQRALILKKKPKKIIIMFDDEPQAIKAAHDLALHLALHVPVVRIAELENDDPATLTHEERRLFLKNLA